MWGVRYTSSMPSAVYSIITGVTTHFTDPKGWQAELAFLDD